MERARLWTSWHSWEAGILGCPSRAARTVWGDSGETSTTEALAGEDGAELGDLADMLME